MSILNRFKYIGELSIVRIYRPAHAPLCILQLSDNEFWTYLQNVHFKSQMKRIYAQHCVAKVANIQLFSEGIYSGDIQNLEVDHKCKPGYFGNSFRSIWPCHFLLQITIYAFRSNPYSTINKTPTPFSEILSMKMDIFFLEKSKTFCFILTLIMLNMV